MQLRSLARTIKTNLHNLSGWTSNRRLVVIESDDWGSIRMPSKEVYESMLRMHLRVDKCPFCKYDSLASNEDLSALFDVLRSFRDRNNRYPAITANTIVANPDFDKIKEGRFEKYFFEPFTDTLKRYPKHDMAFALWNEGIADKIFYPQLHGREHLNVSLWMNMLAMGSQETRFCFDHQMFGISTSITAERRGSYMAALDFQKECELEDIKSIVKDAQVLFGTKFNYRSKSFIAPNYVWSPKIESTLKESGIDFIQSARFQHSPTMGSTKKRQIRHYVGESNRNAQRYLVRNCFFEPSVTPGIDNVDQCLRQIEISFRWRKPAVISCHRVNFVGFIDESNRNRNLKSFAKLLETILKKWPDVEFLTSDELGMRIDASLPKYN